MKDLTSYTHAEQVLWGLGVTHPSEIDIEAIAYSMGARVRYRPLNGCEARIVGNDTQAIISVNSRSAPARRRFSIAHELGHWRYHRGRVTVCTSGEIETGEHGRKPDEERVADRFAADLLMPRYLVRPAVGKIKYFDWKLINHVAGLFGTSAVATAIRLVALNLLPAFVLCHRREGRVWFARAKDVPERWFPRADLDPDSQAFGFIFGGEATGKRTRTPATAWFEHREAERYEMFEESVANEYGEVLTILSILDYKMLEER